MKCVYAAVVVGTSLIRNAYSDGFISAEYRDMVSKALSRDISVDSVLAKLALGSNLLNALTDYISIKGKSCCAELATLYSIKDLVNQQVRSELFSTDSGVAELAMKALASSISKSNVAELVGYARIKLFGGGDLGSGLLHLLNTMGKSLINEVSMGCDAYVGMSGGIKPEAVMASMVAWLVGAKLVYVSEDGKPLIFPRLPLGFRGDALEALCMVKNGLNPSGDVVNELVDAGLLVRDGGLRVVEWVGKLLELNNMCISQRGMH
ncbi:hypothetical protein [Thermocladium modestius]|nr:hypothetical protein [Thermocladium modestius]